MKEKRSKRPDYLSFVSGLILLALATVFIMPAFIFYQVYVQPKQVEREAERQALLQDREQRLNTLLLEWESDKVEDGIHVRTGLVADTHYKLVVQNCTSCHSSKLIAQNRATRENWQKMIRWMQETQNLWDLGNNEGKILDYLAKNYAPEFMGRRAPIPVENLKWYRLGDANQ